MRRYRRLHARSLIGHGSRRLVTTPVAVLGMVENGLELVDALMRLVLVARRHGMTVRLANAPDELRELLELTGLDGVLALEPLGQPEGGEELRVDEVVQPGDPPV